MRLNWIRMTIPALLAVALSLAAVSGVSAQEGGDALAEDDAAVTDEDAPVTINILANDVEDVTLEGVGEPDHGSVFDNGDGTVIYTPDTGFSGVDSFEYTVTDGSESDEATVTITVGEVVDLAVVKGVDDTTPHEGEEITYTISVTNNGPSDATAVEVSDLLPEGVSYVSDGGAGAYAEDTGIWTVGGLAVDATVTLTITAVVDAETDGNTITNLATASADQVDSDDGNDADSADITVGDVADLIISVDVDEDSPAVDDVVTYTIVVINDGPDDATDVVVTDELPEGVSFDSSTPVGAYDSGSGAWVIGDLAAGASATLEIAVTVEDPDAVGGNSASVTAKETDPDESNNTDGAGGLAALAISCDEAATALHPSLATLVCRMFSLIPPGAQAALTSVIEAHVNKVAPGWACRRHLNADGGEPLPGCDRYFDEEGEWDPSGLCERFADAGDVDESPLLARRCQNVIEERGGGNSPLAVCRRLAESDEPGDHEALATRCGELLDEGVKSPRELCTSLGRESVEAHPDLAQRCRNFIDDKHGGRDTSGGSAIAICRSLAESDDPGEHEALAASCGQLLDDGVKNARELCTSLDRESVEAHPDLAQRCRNFIKDKRGDGDDDGDGDGTDGENQRPERGNSGNGGSQSGGQPSSSPGRGSQ